MVENHKIIVQKFGGSSVADAQKIQNVAKRVCSMREQGFQMVVVVSAMGKTTDNLIQLAKEINSNPSEREMDMLMSTGEVISSSILTMAIHALGHEAIALSGSQIGIRTEGSHTRAKIKEINVEKLHQELDRGNIVIVAGFQGVNIHQDVQTLGRGGSDTTAVALAAVLNAHLCEIYTDVDGVYTTDPRIVPQSRKLKTISYDEMLELAGLGAKVMHSRSIEFAKKYGIKVHVRSSLNQNEGTLIVEENENVEDAVIRGIAVDKNQAKITIQKVPDKPGVAAKLFTLLANEEVNIDMIVQNVSEEGHTDISFTTIRSDIDRVKKILEKICKDIQAMGFLTDHTVAKISVVGIGMKSQSGVAASMFDAMAEDKINIQMISTSEIKISCVISEKDVDGAIRKLHERFELHLETMKAQG